MSASLSPSTRQLSRAPPAKTNTALLCQMVGHSQLSSVTRTLSRLSPRQTAAHVFRLLGFLENATLSDLVDLAQEIFYTYKINAGSLFMVGSASYLFRVGASIYADEWLKCQRRITAKWSEVHVSPLIPILRENCPGSPSRDIIEIATWFAKSYADNMAGLLDTWAALIQYVSCNSVGSIPLPTCDIVKISLPDSLTSQTHYAHHFSFSSSCPAVLLAQDSKTTDELLLVLIHTINRDFSVGFDPGDKLARSPIMAGHSKEKHLVVVGASHMKRIVPLLTAAGFTVTDMSQSGWVASAENIDKLVADLSKLAIPTDFVAIFDLLGNASFRFKQYDGSQSLPYKTNHGYHLAGDVEVVNDSTYESLINSLLCLFLQVVHVRVAGSKEREMHSFTVCCPLVNRTP